MNFCSIVSLTAERFAQIGESSSLENLAALIFERVPRFPLPIDLIPVHSHAEMSEPVWDLLNLVRKVESPPYAEHRALFNGLTEAT